MVGECGALMAAVLLTGSGGRPGQELRAGTAGYQQVSFSAMSDKRQRKGSRMMRKTSLVLVGAAVGAGLTVLVTQPPSWSGASARAAAADTYRQLNLFGDIFERVRSHYVEKPDDSKLVEG